MRRLLRQLAEIWTGEKTLLELLEWRRCGGVHFSRGYGNTFFRDEVSPRDNVKDGGNVENARIGCDVSNIDSTFKESGKGNDHCIALFASVRVRHLGFPSIYLCYLPSRFFLSSPSSASLTGSRLTYILATCGRGRGPGRNHLNKRASMACSHISGSDDGGSATARVHKRSTSPENATTQHYRSHSKRTVSEVMGSVHVIKVRIECR